MEADNKENVAGYNLCTHVSSNMENGGDQNNSIAADVTSIQEGLLDLSTAKSSVVAVDHKEDRWIKEPIPCSENSEEEEVFFGDVTNKEIKKKKKFNARKTAVFLPGFRMDRRLMRYTMGPTSLNSVGEKEETMLAGIDEEIADTNKECSAEYTNEAKEKSVGDNMLSTKDDDPERELDEECKKDHVEQNDSVSEASNGEVFEEDTTEIESVEASNDSTCHFVTSDKGMSCCTDLCPIGSFQQSVSNGGSEEMENLISEVLNESLNEVDKEPDCSLLLPSGANGESSSSSGSDCDSTDESSDEEMSNEELVNNMMRVLDKRTAFLAVLAKMRQRPDNNPNTKGKPESFERMLQESENKHVDDNPEKEDEDSESGDSQENQPSLPKVKESNEKECDHLSNCFENLEIEKPDNRILQEENTSESAVKSDALNSGSESRDRIEQSPATKSEISKCERDTYSQEEETQGEPQSNEVSDDDRNNKATFMFMNRNNSNSIESDVSLDQVADDIAHLTLNTLPQPEILPNISDDRAFAIDTIAARTADSEELAVTLPELDVNEIIDLLTDGPNNELFTPQRDGTANIVADGNLMTRRIDNTMVVASNNPIASPLIVYPTLPEISARIGATHTVTSVRGPISSPGAVRSERRYRSIYATLPTDSSDIETQVVPATDFSTNILPAFGNLSIDETTGPPCSLDDSLLSGTQLYLKVDSSHQEGDELDSSLCPSPKPPTPKVQGDSEFIIQGASSPVQDHRYSPERPERLCSGDAEIRSPCQALGSGFSPSVVFTEKNFSPILKVHFPPSSPVEVPVGLKCTAHNSMSPKSTECSSHLVSRDNKRKQPSGEESLPKEITPPDVQNDVTKSKITPTKCKVPRTPPKKVIGQPNVHKFHTAFGKNPASRSLVHKFSIHVSPKVASKLAPRTPASNPRARAKSPVSARKLLTAKPPALTRTPSSKTVVTGHLVSPGITRIKNSNLVKTPSNVTSRPAPGSNKTPSAQSGKKTPAKTRLTPGVPGACSAQRLSASKGVHPSGHGALGGGPVQTLFTRPSPSRAHGTPRRQVATPKTPSSHQKSSVPLGHLALSGRPRGTPLRVIDGEVTSSPITLRPKVTDSGKSGQQAALRSTASGDDQVFEAESSQEFGDSPVVFRKGTPRYLPGDPRGDLEPDIFSEEPPVFELDDIFEDDHNGSASRESSPRLSMEDVLERKRQQMMNLRAEKRKIQDIISKQGSPTVKSPRANNTVSHDTPPKQRFSNTQTLSLSDKELEAVTQLHTLCNSQRTVKVIHKGRAMLIRQVPLSPHTPRRLSWNEHLQVEIDENESPSTPSSPEDVTSRKPILSKKDARYVYPYDDEPAAPVVVFRSRNGDRQRSTRSPRID